MYSVGLLYSTQEFIDFVIERRVLAEDVKSSFVEFGLAKLSDVLSLVQRVGWIAIDIDGHLAVTDLGLKVSSLRSEQRRLREQLAHLTAMLRPAWLSLFPSGRGESYPFLPEGVQQCIREAGLLSDQSGEVNDWWDNLANFAYADRNRARSAVGREGERRSREFERARTGVEPEWKALFSNKAGYDLLSRVDSRSEAPLCIEVKASNQSWNEARFFVTSSEWDVALGTKDYVFHLWLLQHWTKPKVLTTTEVALHMPSNRNDGEWQQTVIPFKSLTAVES